MTTTAPPPLTPTPPRTKATVTRPGDRIFAGMARGSGILLLVVMAAIAIFLTVRAVSAISKDHANFLTTFEWTPSLNPPVFGIAVLAYGTVVSALIAMLIAVPIALGIALFITHYAPRRLGGPVAYVIDLLAAVPSIVYGLWGALFLVPHLKGLNLWLDKYFGWTVVLGKSDPNSSARSLLTVGILLAIIDRKSVV